MKTFSGVKCRLPLGRTHAPIALCPLMSEHNHYRCDSGLLYCNLTRLRTRILLVTSVLSIKCRWRHLVELVSE